MKSTLLGLHVVRSHTHELPEGAYDPQTQLWVGAAEAQAGYRVWCCTYNASFQYCKDATRACEKDSSTGCKVMRDCQYYEGFGYCYEHEDITGGQCKYPTYKV